jgi:hypothetical protein
MAGTARHCLLFVASHWCDARKVLRLETRVNIAEPSAAVWFGAGGQPGCAGPQPNPE